MKSLFSLLVLAGLAYASPTLPTRELVDVADGINKQPNVNWSDYRFLSFGNLSQEDMDAKKAAVKMVVATVNATNNNINSILHEASPVLWGVNIKKAGWTAEAWDDMSKDWAYYSEVDPSLRKFLKEKMGTEFPVMRADLFAVDAWKSKWYTKFLGLLETKSEFLKKFNIRQEKPSVVAIVANGLTVTTNPGKIARYSSSDGRAVWIRMNYMDTKGKNNSVKHPMNVDCDYNEVSFELPSGLDAYVSFDGETGKLSKFSDTKIANHDGGALELGTSCFSCHTNGAKGLTHVEEISALTIPSGFDKLFNKAKVVNSVEEDRNRWAVSLKKINGLTPSENSKALAKLTLPLDSNVTAIMASKELGVNLLDLVDRAGRSSNKEVKNWAGNVKGVSRQKYEEIYGDIIKLYSNEDREYIASILK